MRRMPGSPWRDGAGAGPAGRRCRLRVDCATLERLMPDKLDPNLVSRVLASLGSPPAPFLGNLAEIFGPGLPPPPPPIIQARYFKNETIRIDGYTFERCRFDGCHLVTEWSTFAFRECGLSPDCGLYFTGPALK